MSCSMAGLDCGASGFSGWGVEGGASEKMPLIWATKASVKGLSASRSWREKRAEASTSLVAILETSRW